MDLEKDSPSSVTWNSLSFISLTASAAESCSRKLMKPKPRDSGPVDSSTTATGLTGSSSALGSSSLAASSSSFFASSSFGSGETARGFSSLSSSFFSALSSTLSSSLAFSATTGAVITAGVALGFLGNLFLLPILIVTLTISPNFANSLSIFFSSHSNGIFLTKQFVKACASGRLSRLMNTPTCTSFPSINIPSSFSMALLAASFVS
mmetsp:Transcript_32148/g.58131  ORF Transcript_32148/g.58131 Transcript_32148/m.58131 type:complete len:207 (-) Transcript_32148:827-1447(-)